MSKIYNGQIYAEVAERTGLSLSEVKQIFNVYTEVVQEKITEAKTGDIVELAGGVGSLTVSLGASRKYRSFESTEQETVYVETACNRRAKLNVYQATKANMNVQKPEYGITDEDTLAYISQHRMSSKYTVKRADVEEVKPLVEVQPDTKLESSATLSVKKRKTLKSLFSGLSKKIVVAADNEVVTP